jgi:hypothetical protein
MTLVTPVSAVFFKIPVCLWPPFELDLSFVLYPTIHRHLLMKRNYFISTLLMYVLNMFILVIYNVLFLNIYV